MSKRSKDVIIDVASSKRKRKQSPSDTKKRTVVKKDEMGCLPSKKRRVDRPTVTSPSSKVIDLTESPLSDSTLSVRKTRTVRRKPTDPPPDPPKFSSNYSKQHVTNSIRSPSSQSTEFSSISLTSAVRKARTVRKKSPVPSTSSTSDSEQHVTPSICLTSSQSSANDWDCVDYVSESTGISISIAKTVIKLLENENTIPFIARYRRAQTNDLDADELRAVKDAYEKSKQIKNKADNVIKAIEKAGKWTPQLHNFVRSVKSISDLEQIHSLYKETSKLALAEKARKLGLESPAQSIINGINVGHFRNFINKNKEGLREEDEIKENIVCILSDIIVKDKQVFDERIKLKAENFLQIQTKKTKDADKNEKLKTYEMYLDWSMSEKNIKPHQILAINRAESEKIITVKYTLPDRMERSLLKFVLNLYPAASRLSFNRELLTSGFNRAFKNSIKPTIVRRTKAEMSEKAEEASIESFAVNVKQKLLSAQVRGKIVLGVDPGFTAGCKMAVVSVQGDVLETSTIYPHKGDKLKHEAANIITKLVKKHQCDTIALGSATACRETEQFLSDLIDSGKFLPIDVVYTIVDESGASVYSCSAEAKAEFPNMDINVISAVSIARRLQDPLAEYVKIEPKSLGVGMYQHSLPEKKLAAKLDEIVMEAVSFVGVDVNTASQCLLRRVAGLSDKKAANIIQHRKDNGPFLNREMLKKVSGIGPKTFEQCAGFIRIVPETASTKLNTTNNFNILDQTWIHPESYELAKQFIKACGVDLKNLGSREFISSVNIFAGQGIDILAKRFNTDTKNLEVIIKSLTMKKGEDIREQNDAPIFRKSVRSIDDLTVGCLLSGVVRNIVAFGAFVDIGVGRDALIHSSHLRNQDLRITQRVDVKVEKVDKETQKIGLILIKAN